MEFTPRQARLHQNLQAIRQRIDRAAVQSGRSAEDVKLVAVTKYVDADVTRDLFLAGCHDLGESRPQQLWSKAEVLADIDCRWHMIGHLQRNKVERTLPLASLIHSVDSERLLTAINKSAADIDRVVEILLEVNTSGETEKHGLRTSELPAVLARAAEWPHVRICGLMTMAARHTAGSAARSSFAALRELRDRLTPECPGVVSLDELSMGMSGDFEEAIGEGATIVRVGSALFDGVE